MSPAEYNQVVAASIRRQRLSLGLSQAALAQAVGVSEASISRWECSGEGIRAYTYDRLKAYFRACWKEREAAAQ